MVDANDVSIMAEKYVPELSGPEPDKKPMRAGSNPAFGAVAERANAPLVTPA